MAHRRAEERADSPDDENAGQPLPFLNHPLSNPHVRQTSRCPKRWLGLVKLEEHMKLQG